MTYPPVSQFRTRTLEAEALAAVARERREAQREPSAPRLARRWLRRRPATACACAP